MQAAKHPKPKLTSKNRVNVRTIAGWNMQRGWWPAESAANREAVTPSDKQERKCSASKARSVLQEAGIDKN